MERTGLMAATALLLAACGGGGGTEPPDGGPGGANRLELIDAAAAELGLPFRGVAVVAVRYLDPLGAPLPDRDLRFSFLDDPARDDDGPRGATLAVDRARTDGRGEARLELRAGFAEARFGVRIEAAGALPLVLAVSVSDAGFAELEVAPSAAADTRGLVTARVRLVESAPCAEISALAPPEPLAPEKVTDLPAANPVRFTNLLVSTRYAVLTRGADAEGRIGAAACADLGAGQLRVGERARLAPTVVPLPIAAPPAAALSLELALAPLAADVAAALDEAAALDDCPLDPGEALVAAAIEAIVDGPTRAAVEARRGAIDAAGCRGTLTSGGAPSLEASAADLLAAVSDRPDQRLARLGSETAAALAAITLESVLTLPVDGGEPLPAAHALAAVTAGGHRLDLRALTAPVLTAGPIPTTRGPATLALGRHGFTLRLGAIAAALQRALLADDLALAAGARAALDAVVGPIRRGAATGCEALEGLLCDEAALAAGCAAGACAAGLDALAARLEARPRLLDGAGLDLELSLELALDDADGDLLAERLTGGAEVTLTTSRAAYELAGDVAGGPPEP